jgi:hypothetical protein
VTSPAIEAPRRGPFIVLGMGRSGTSYIGSVLAANGIDMGAELKTADEQNRNGYFEDVETTRMHEHWLARRGLNLASVHAGFPLEVDPDEQALISAYVARREASADRWGVKAPGILFFWNGWREVLPKRSVLLVPFRHPAAVADSFERYGLDRERALALWLQLNTLAIEAAAGPFESLFLDFDDRPVLLRALRSILQAFHDPYEPGLRHEPADAGALSGQHGALYSELRARAVKSAEAM